jgi:hypothetical protein
MTQKVNYRKRQIPQLRVVFDTNVLYTGSASDLVRQEVADLIRQNVFPDLEVQWYLPELVRHERQYQMQRRALELLPAVARVERLLGHNLAITEQILIDSVEKAVSQRQQELGLVSVTLDFNKIDWHRVALDAVYRRPPFKEGETEKGFRDSLIVECFLQLVADSPRTPKVCRIVLVSGDRLVAQAVEARTTESTNTAVFSTLEELKGLINTLVSQVDELFLASLKPKAQKLFFVPKEESTLYYKEHIRDKLKEKFAAELAAPPQGATTRTNGTWHISPPNFVKKTGRRIQWASRIEVEAEAGKSATQPAAIELSSLRAAPSVNISSDYSLFKPVAGWSGHSGTVVIGGPGSTTMAGVTGEGTQWANYLEPFTAFTTITTHKGVDVYEVLWSADVTTDRELRRPSIDEIRHSEPRWEQVT